MAFGRGRWSRGRTSASRQGGPGRGQGPMRAMFSGALPIIRHTVTNTSSGIGNVELTDGKAYAYPLVVYYGGSGTITDGQSSTSTTSNASSLTKIESFLEGSFFQTM